MLAHYMKSDGVNFPVLKKDQLWFGLLLLVLMAMGLAHSWLNETLRFEHAAIAQGQVWRVLTAHFVHVNANHMWLNLAGLTIGMLIVGGVYRVWQWALSMVLISLFISLLLFFFSPEVGWYVGFSGVLHGILALGFLTYVIHGDFVFVLALVILIGKVVREQMPSFDSMHLHGIISAPVVQDSHLYGFIAGIFIAFLWQAWQKLKTRPASKAPAK